MKNPYFPLFVRDWLCSRRILSMSGPAVKAYMYLLCESWLQEPRATLPNNDRELASMARMSEDEFILIKKEVMQHYILGTCDEHNGRLYQNTLLEVSRKSEANQRLGNKNAKKRETYAKKRETYAKKRETYAGSEYENANTNEKTVFI